MIIVMLIVMGIYFGMCCCGVDIICFDVGWFECGMKIFFVNGYSVDYYCV